MTYTCQHTILTSWAGAVVDAAEREGIPGSEILGPARIDIPKNAQSGSRLPHDIMRPLWDQVCRLSGDAAFPIKAASILRPNSIHALGFGLLAAGSLDEACRMIRRNFHVISTAAALKINVTGNQYQIVSVCEPAVNHEGFEMFMAYLQNIFQLLEPEPINPLKVTLNRSIANSASRERYKSFFQAPVEFDAPTNSMVFSRLAMFEPLRTANAEICKYSERLLMSYLEQFGSGEFKTLVRSKILELLIAGSVSEDAVARGLNMSRSSLARRLRAEGATYRKLFYETQRNLALQYLGNKDLPIGEISLRLGFQDLSSFSRSFRRWTGMSPREWRNRHLAG